MKKFLVKFSKYWADEFKCESMRLMENESAESIIKEIGTWWKECEGIRFGTNEGWDLDEMDISSDVTVTEVTAIEFETISRLLGTSFGVGGIEM